MRATAKSASAKPYAAGTTISSGRSQDDIQQTLRRYGATKFLAGSDDEAGTFAIAFVIPARTGLDGEQYAHPMQVRFSVRVPVEKLLYVSVNQRSQRERSATELQAAIAKETDRLWRALALGIKAKLVLVDDGIETIEQALYAHVVNPHTNRTVWEETHGQVAEAHRRIESGPAVRKVFTLTLPPASAGAIE